MLSLVAVLAAVAAGAFYFIIEDDRSELGRRLDSVATQLRDVRETAGTLTAERERLNARLASTLGEINEIKARNTTLEARNGQLSREITQARTELRTLRESNDVYERQVADLNRRLVEARALVDASILGSNAESTAARDARIEDLEREVARLRRGNNEPDPEALARVPADLRASVVDVSPQSAFVVLDVGSSHGAIPAMEMILRRGSVPLARVRLTEVRESYSIAHVLPMTQAGPIRPGDTATRS